MKECKLQVIVGLVLILIAALIWVKRISVSNSTIQQIQEDESTCEIKWSNGCSLQPVNINGVKFYSVEVNKDG